MKDLKSTSDKTSKLQSSLCAFDISLFDFLMKIMNYNYYIALVRESRSTKLETNVGMEIPNHHIK